MGLSISFYSCHPLVEASTKVTTRQNRTFFGFIPTIAEVITGIFEEAGQVGVPVPTSARSACDLKGALRGNVAAGQNVHKYVSQLLPGPLSWHPFTQPFLFPVRFHTMIMLILAFFSCYGTISSFYKVPFLLSGFLFPHLHNRPVRAQHLVICNTPSACNRAF